MKRTMLLLSISVLATLISGWVKLAEAQQTGKVYRIGWLRMRPSPPTGSTSVAFRQKLRELGYVEGQNLVIEFRSAKREPERRPDLAAELLRLKVDVIVVPGSASMVRDWQRATRTVPIVMMGIRVDPVEAGLVDSLARPGGNITGLTDLNTELRLKRLELLKEVIPGISRVAILWTENQQEYGMEEIEAAGQALGVQIQSLDVWEGLESAFSAISREAPDALLVERSSATLDLRAQIIEFAAKRRLPTIYGGSDFAKAGGFMSYSTDRLHLFSRVAIYVDKILKGAKPADLPVEQPTKFELVINLKTAGQVGVTIPPSILYRADKVIK